MIEMFEIIVWCADQSTGDRFIKQTKDDVDNVTKAVSQGRGFSLIQNDNSTILYGPDKVTKVQISSYYGEKLD